MKFKSYPPLDENGFIDEDYNQFDLLDIIALIIFITAILYFISN